MDCENAPHRIGSRSGGERCSGHSTDVALEPQSLVEPATEELLVPDGARDVLGGLAEGEDLDSPDLVVVIESDHQGLLLGADDMGIEVRGPALAVRTGRDVGVDEGARHLDAGQLARALELGLGQKDGAPLDLTAGEGEIESLVDGEEDARLPGSGEEAEERTEEKGARAKRASSPTGRARIRRDSQRRY